MTFIEKSSDMKALAEEFHRINRPGWMVGLAETDPRYIPPCGYKPSQWNCEYCGAAHAMTKWNCGQCGGPRR